MKEACKNCGSIEWIKLHIHLIDGDIVHHCDRCNSKASKLSPLFKGLPTPKTKVSQHKYNEAVKLANKKGKTINL